LTQTLILFFQTINLYKKTVAKAICLH